MLEMYWFLDQLNMILILQTDPAVEAAMEYDLNIYKLPGRHLQSHHEYHHVYDMLGNMSAGTFTIQKSMQTKLCPSANVLHVCLYIFLIIRQYVRWFLYSSL